MLRSIENICSYVQCRWRNVWRVYTDFNTLSCLNYFVQRVWGVYKMVVEIPKGWGGYFSGQKMEIPGRRGDPTWNSLRGGGMDIFWNYTFEKKVPKQENVEFWASWHNRYNWQLSIKFTSVISMTIGWDIKIGDDSQASGVVLTYPFKISEFQSQIWV